MIALAIDTVTRYPSISLVEDDHVLAMRDLSSEMGAMDRIVTDVMDLMNEAGIKISDLGLIVPVTGPGSFTGVRIGLAAAGGLSYTGKIPMIGVSSFDMYGQALADPLKNNVICIDSKRFELFFKVIYKDNQSSSLIYSFNINEFKSFINSKNEEFITYGDSINELKKENINLIYKDKIIKSPHAAFYALAGMARGALTPLLDIPEAFYFRGADVSQSKKSVRHISE